MNGRVYDPQLGRFMSVDPVFQFPTNTQSLNPYTYVLNSPLSLTDPTGLEEKPVVSSDSKKTKGNSTQQSKNAGSGKKTEKEKREDRAENRAAGRGATISHSGRMDTTGSERQAGKQSNGALLSEADRMEFAGTPKRSGTEGINNLAGRIVRASLQGGVGECDAVEASLSDIDIMTATPEQLSGLSAADRELVLTLQALYAGTMHTLEGNVAAMKALHAAGTASEADVAAAKEALVNFFWAKKTFSTTSDCAAGAQTYDLTNTDTNARVGYEIVYFRAAQSIVNQGIPNPSAADGYFVPIPAGAMGLLYTNMHEAGHMVSSNQVDSHGNQLPRPGREHSADGFLRNVIDNTGVR